MPSKKLILLNKKSNKSYLVKDASFDFHTTDGIIKSKDLKSKQQTITSSKKVEFIKINPNIGDLKQNFSRGPQIMQDKDIGLIIAKTGINKESVVVDAGAGSGAVSISLANICKQVICYDTNPAHIKVVQKNKLLTNCKNLTIKQGDVAKDLTEKNLDLITLDLPKPWEAFAKIIPALKLGAHVVIYLPNIMQINKTISELKNHKQLTILELTELIKRDWKIDFKKEILRPEHTQVVHTGFLLFLRKLN